jgi:C1A family cysteine protease
MIGGAVIFLLYLTVSSSFEQDLDWRNFNSTNYIGDVYNQRKCGVCWVFSTLSMVENTLSIQTGYKIKLSEQQIVDCCPDCRWDDNDACLGGFPLYVLQYIQQYGIGASVSYGKYVAQQRPCKTINSVVNITDIVMLPNNEEYFLDVLQNNNIIASVNSKGLKDYSSGIILSSACPEGGGILDHAVNIIGYGIENGIKYWTVKNSYGNKWGEHGYFRIERGNNTCGIEQEAMYITQAFKIADPEVLYSLDEIYNIVDTEINIQDIIVYCLCGITGVCVLLIIYFVYRYCKK